MNAPPGAPDLAAFALGERTPDRLHVPADVRELAALLGACDREGRAVVLFGGNTLPGMGHPPARYDDAIAFDRMNAIVAYDHRDLTVGAEAGCRLATLEAALAASNQFVPFDAPRARSATLGGTLAAGWLGPRRLAYGQPRDFVLGTTVVLPDGTIARAGGNVVKNVTGYDLSKLYIGSLGTLAAIATANLRTFPLPRARRLVIAGIPDGSRARARANVAALDREPVAALFVRGFTKEIDGTDGGEGRAVMLYEGSEPFVDAATREIRSALGAAGMPETRLLDAEAATVFSRVLDAYVAPVSARSATYRSFGLASSTAARFDAFERVASENKLVCDSIEDLRTGDVIARLSTRVNAHFPERIVAFDGARRTALASARVIAAPASVVGLLDAWGAPPLSLDAIRALKARFDPNGTLAPGRYVAGI